MRKNKKRGKASEQAKPERMPLYIVAAITVMLILGWYLNSTKEQPLGLLHKSIHCNQGTCLFSAKVKNLEAKTIYGYLQIKALKKKHHANSGAITNENLAVNRVIFEIASKEEKEVSGQFKILGRADQFIWYVAEQKED